MATVSKLTSAGNHSITGEYDEITLPSVVQFNGAQYIISPASSAYNIGTNNFTIEAWVYFNTISGSVYSAIGGVWLGGRQNWLLQCISGNIQFATSTTGSNYVIYNFATTLTTGQWYHIAITCSSLSVRAFVNGNQVGTTAGITGIYGAGNQGLYIGANIDQGPQSFLNGYISNFRFIVGTALYTSAFSTNLPYLPLTAITNTKLLTCQGSTIVDAGTANGGLPFTISNPTGATVVTTATSWMKLKSKQYSNGTLQTLGSLDEVTGLTVGVKSRLYSNGSFLVAGSFDEYTNTTVTVQYLVAAGGGGGGGGGGDPNFFYGGGGGGAGYLFTGTTTFTRSVYNIVVGTGGSGGAGGTGTRGNNGSNSSVTTGATTVFLAEGGGYGATATGTGGVGGNGGGGGGRGYTPGTATQGYRGGYGNGGTANGYGGGGGGAAAVGNNSGMQPPGGAYVSTGGAGIASTISGASVTYCQGGGGGPGSTGVGPGCGGGGGGGGTWGGGGAGAAGKDGIVIFSYPLGNKPPATTTGTVAVTTNGSNSVYTFTGNGTIIFN